MDAQYLEQIDLFSKFFNTIKKISNGVPGDVDFGAPGDVSNLEKLLDMHCF